MDPTTGNGISPSVEVIAFTKVALPYGWLGNMAPFPIMYGGKMWRTSEALFQALRFADDDSIRETIRLQTSPMAAKMTAKKNRERMVVTPQSAADLALMRQVLRLKVESHHMLRGDLIDTGNALIIEDSTNRQNSSGLFWGAARQADGSWKGANQLGHAWMELRGELK